MRGVWIAALVALGAPVAAEVAQTGTYTLAAERRDVALTGNTSGKTRPAEQVIVTVTRRDGAPVRQPVQNIAARLACGGAAPLVAFEAAAQDGAKAYEFLCPKG